MWGRYVVAEFGHDAAVVGSAGVDRWSGVAGRGEL
jgi:hypothetical protein